MEVGIGVPGKLQPVVAAILGSLLLALAASAAQAEKRVALVVGNSNYKNAPRLPNPERDATAIAEMFRKAGFDTVVEANNVGNLDFKRAIRKFEDATLDADIAVVFYAGHGIEVRGINYLMPVNARLASDRDAQDEAITLNRVVELVDAARKLRLIILDACRDNPFIHNMKRFRRRSAQRSTAAGRGLGQVQPTGTNTLIAYAAKAGSTAEDGDGNHSPFTTALLDNLIVPGLDIRLAFGRVRDEVLKITQRRQEPFVYGSLGGGNISLVPAPSKPEPPKDKGIKADYALVAQIGTSKAWQVFLDTYPKGFYADLARAQLAKLKAASPPNTVVASLEPAPKPTPPESTTDERRAWQKISNTSDRAALEKFIERYPDSPLAVNAQHRLDILDKLAEEREKQREEEARAKREAAQRAAQERIAARQRAEEEKRKKEAARLAELKAENERREKQAAESAREKKQQAARLAALQAEIARRTKELAEARKQKTEQDCRREQARLKDIGAAGHGPAVRDDLNRLLEGLACERLRPDVVAALDRTNAEIKKNEKPPAPPENTPELIESAQNELTRLGCFAGKADGQLGPITKIAIKKYRTRKEQPVDDIAVTKAFVQELGKEKLRVCPAVVADRPEPKHTAKKKDEREKSSRHSRKREAQKRQRPRARQQARSGRSGGTAMIGIGF